MFKVIINDVPGDANLQTRGTHAKGAVRHGRERTRTLSDPASTFSAKSLSVTRKQTQISCKCLL